MVGDFLGVFPRVFFGDGTSDENGRPLKIWWTSQSRVKQMIFRHGFETAAKSIAVSTKNDMAICFQVLKGFKTFPYWFSGPFP